MQRCVGVVAIIFAIAIVGNAAQAQTTGPGILPGEGLGSFRIGQDLAPIITALGPLHQQDDFPGGNLRGYYWPLRRIAVIVNRDTQKVAALGISYDDSYQTEKGVQAGSQLEAIRQAYGQEETVDNHQDDDTFVYDKLGVAFVVDKNGALGGRVSVIFVFTQGQYKDIFK
jgi:hypothetical protein